MRVLRLLAGGLVQSINWLTQPKLGQREASYQAQVEEALASHSLYQFAGCPFCIKVRRAARRLNLPLQLRDARPGSEHRSMLLEQGGQVKVPCLRIDKADGSSVWMYESSDIITYLSRQFPLASGTTGEVFAEPVKADA